MIETTLINRDSDVTLSSDLLRIYLFKPTQSYFKINVIVRLPIYSERHDWAMVDNCIPGLVSLHVPRYVWSGKV